MIEGIVNAYAEATVELAIRGPEGREETIEFLVDTGFDGALTLHSALVAELGLEKVGIASAILADGSSTTFSVCNAVVSWAGRPLTVTVQISDTVALLGMTMLEGHELRMEVIPDGPVQITPITDLAAQVGGPSDPLHA